MSLPAVNWRYVGNQPFAVASVEAVLNAIYTLGTAVTYADGTARTPGVGSAGTYSRYQNVGVTEAVYLTPATTTALAQRIILAGAAGAAAPTMASPDTYTANNLMIGLNKNSGAFNAWTAALPFTAGQWFGYWRVWPTSAGTGSVDLYENTEGIWVVVRNSTGSATYHCCAGATLDPESSDASDAESDGRIYGVWVTGSGAAAAVTFTDPSFVTDWCPWCHDTSNGTAHSATFVPGSGTLAPCRLVGKPNFTTPSNTYLRTRSGRYGRINSPAVSLTAATSYVVGAMRGVGIYSKAIHGQRQVDSGVTIGYIVGPQTTAQNTCYILLYA